MAQVVDGVAITPPRHLFRHAPFLRLLGGQTVSSLGDWLATVAFMALALDLTGSAVAVGGILALRMAPGLLAGPLGTIVADRIPPRRLLVGADLVRAAAIALVPVIPSLAWVYVWAFVTEAVTFVALPARDAAIPRLVHRPELSLANGLMMGSSYGNIPLGAVAFAGIVALSRAVPVLHGHAILVAFELDAATFLISAWATLGTSGLGEAARAARPGDTLRTQIRQAGRFLVGHPVTRALAPAIVVGALGGGTLFGLGMVFVLRTLGATQAAFGYLVALFGIGMAGGVALLGAASKRRLPRLRIVRAGAVSMGALLAVMAVAPSLAASYAAAVAFGAAMAATFVQGVTMLQECVEPAWRGSALTAFHVVLRLTLALSALGGGLVAQALEGVRVGSLSLDGTQATFVLAGALMAWGGLLVRPRPAVGSVTGPWDCNWRSLPCAGELDRVRVIRPRASASQADPG